MPGQKRVFALDVPGIHVLCAARKGVDGRDKPGHDGNAYRAAPSVNAVSITAPNGCQERPSNWTSRVCLIGR